jgi:curved DNA-binding protein CbpA
MTDINENPYGVLELDRAATLDEIKQAYFTQVRQHPPEREPEAFKRIRAAYDQLKTPEKRVEADMRLLEDWPPAKAGAPTRAARLPELDLTLHAEDVLSLLKANTDLTRTNFREDFREVRL